MRWLRERVGQSTLEYVIVLTAIIAAVILATPQIRTHITNSLNHAAQEMQDGVEEIQY